MARLFPLGGRALDILIALSERPGELVCKADLIARVWPNRTVEEGNLRFHVAVLRKALSAGCDDSRVICTVPGRGYQLVAETSFAIATQGLTPSSVAACHAQPAPVSDIGKGALSLIGSRALCAQSAGFSGEPGNNHGPVEAQTSPGVKERDKVLLFGPFELSRKTRVLKKHGAPICLGGRALDLLIALIERPYEVVTKHELTDKVWPDRVVAEGNLRFQLSALRKALEDGKAGNRYITNVPGRGYCFVARVTPTDRGGAMPLSGLGDQACLGAPAARTAITNACRSPHSRLAGGPPSPGPWKMRWRRRILRAWALVVIPKLR
ncbi:MAG: winged helix-turn-helix domain-containing protein [Acetobacteraceae bacterium]